MKAKTKLEAAALRLRTPRAVQNFLRSLPYNREVNGETLRSAEAALRAGEAHCFEAALLAAGLLEYAGYPPLLLSLDSVDDLDHVVFVFKEETGWGSVGRSRDDGLHGRPPRFRSLRDLAWSYFDPYIDKTGRIQGYGLMLLDESGIDWRLARSNLWRLDDFRLAQKHKPLRSSDERYQRLYKRYLRVGPLPKHRNWW